jgi:hypothetical protein
MQEKVTRLVQEWRQPLADSVAAMNLFIDETAPRRASQIAALRDAAGGNCRPEGPFVVENALRGRWKMRCATGSLGVGITLAPTEPARVQQFTVYAMPLEGAIPLPLTCRQ